MRSVLVPVLEVDVDGRHVALLPPCPVQSLIRSPSHSHSCSLRSTQLTDHLHAE